MGKPRFKDTGKRIYDFLDCVLVECPRCHRCAKIIGNPRKYYPKLVCEMCGLTRSKQPVSIGSEKYGEFNLWLKTDCCGNTLWAYNEEHLDYLESYVSASLREHIPNINNNSVASRLPNWIKSAKNRESILKCILKLRQRLNFK